MGVGKDTWNQDTYISVSSLDMGTKDAMILFYLYLFV